MAWVAVDSAQQSACHPAPRQRPVATSRRVLELGATFEEGVQREVLEETGMRVRVERLSGVYKNMPRGIVALVFRCSPVGGRLTTTDEALSVRWLSVDQIQQHMDPAYVVRVTDAFSEGTRARVHDGIDLVNA